MKQLHKVFSILMPLLFLAFSQYPCADRYTVPVSNQNTSITQLSLDNEGTDMQHFDQCSPLCTCTCCTASITSVVLDIVFPYVELSYSYTPTYYNETPKGVYTSIWQPPKIA